MQVHENSGAGGLRCSVQSGLEVVRAAEREARDIIAVAKREADELRREAERSGYDTGCREAAVQLLNGARLEQDILLSSRETIIAIALAVAREVLGENLETRPEALIRRVERALEYARNSVLLKLCCAPEDAALLQAAFSADPQSCPLECDPSLPRGTARLVTSWGTVEASPRTHYEAACLALTEHSAGGGIVAFSELEEVHHE